MRLLKLDNNGDISMTKDLIDDIPPYGILSHTWAIDEEEVTFLDFHKGKFKNGSGKTKLGYEKIRFCAKQAANNRLEYFWLDTCCINKADHSELSEAIISMFRWYRNAAKCFVYLMDLSCADPSSTEAARHVWDVDFKTSRWFSRGWTLQELIAPMCVEFFSAEGMYLGDKVSLESLIHEITGISVKALRGGSLREFDVPERMAWAATRVTKRKEDQAYCLMGIFDVYMPPLYGEGVLNAFQRLHDGITKKSVALPHGDSFPGYHSLTVTADVLHSGTAFGPHEDFIETTWRANAHLIQNSTKRCEMESILLEHVGFANIGSREDRIAKAVTDTFEWIFSEQWPDHNQHLWHPFVPWLQSNAGLYWIAGKAGSGKSTLMKFIHADTRTQQHLKIWAEDSKLIVASHFFWNSGDSIQMSVSGLVRNLLHCIGTNTPSLLPFLFPRMWTSLSTSTRPEMVSLPSWSLSRCLEALRRLLLAPFDDYRIFFLIDGLDECDGDHEELTRLLEELAHAPHIKVCLASRPWTVFRDAFERDPSLVLQHLTARDINVYVENKFAEHYGFQELARADSKLAAQLANNITEKASGVFLWVTLAVQSLLHGVAQGDRMTDLMQRLEDLPEDLEMLFRKILDSVDPAYRSHSAQLFKIHRTACEMDSGITLLRLSYADDDDEALWDEERMSLDREQIIYRLKTMVRRLDSRTKGLLEISTSFLEELERLSYFDIITGSRANSQVQYLHRTLKDYLEQPKIWNEICPVDPSFNPHAALCKAYGLEIHQIDARAGVEQHPSIGEHFKGTWKDMNVRISDLVADAMRICTLVRDQPPEQLIHVLHGLNAVLTRKFRLELRPSTSQAPLHLPVITTLAVRYDLAFWLNELLRRNCPLGAEATGVSLIFIAVDSHDSILLPGLPTNMSWDKQGIDLRPSGACLRVLLSHGLDVNEQYEGRTAWSYVTQRLRIIMDRAMMMDLSSVRAGSDLLFADYLDVAEMFLSYGADQSLLHRDIIHTSAKELARTARRERWIGNGLENVLRLCRVMGIDYDSLSDQNEREQCEDITRSTRNDESSIVASVDEEHACSADEGERWPHQGEAESDSAIEPFRKQAEPRPKSGRWKLRLKEVHRRLFTR